MKIITDARCLEYCLPGHPERPERISATIRHLRAQTALTIAWLAPPTAGDAAILRAHSARHLARLDVPIDFDAETPHFNDIAGHARRSVGAALEALRLARAGEAAFSLMRPPGHHATREQAMGFCYLNSVAIAALEALARGFPRVAVFDFDVHHGNGTEAILVNHHGAAFFSIHLHPCYPDTGVANVGHNCFNFPVTPGTPRPAYRAALSAALDGLRKFQPDLVAVSAGFDAYLGDPLAQGTLEAEDFHWLGRSLRDLGVPNFSVLEGGYSDDLPQLILAYLLGLEGRPFTPPSTALRSGA
jgi:acetoin utilization deacetylase AcuC-like enzyme